MTDDMQSTEVDVSKIRLRTVDARDPLAQFLRNVLRLHWFELWFLALLVYGPVEKLLIPALVGYLDLTGTVTTWVPHAEALLTGFIEFPFFLGFYLWTGPGIAALFTSMQRNRCFVARDGYEEYMQRVEASFNRGSWSLLSFGLAILTVTLVHCWLWGPNADIPPWFGERLYARVVALILIFFVAYAIFQSVIREVLTVFWLRKLWNEMGDKLVVHPYHADSAGGVAEIGQHTVVLLCFALILMLFVVGASVLPSFLRPVEPGQEVALAMRFWSAPIIVIWVLYLLLFPVMLYLLLWPAHKQMCRIRDDLLNRVSGLLDRQLDYAEVSLTPKEPRTNLPRWATIWRALTGQPGDQASAGGQGSIFLPDLYGSLADTMKGFKNLHEYHTLIRRDYPIWPISETTRRLFGLTSFLPAAYSALAILIDLLA